MASATPAHSRLRRSAASGTLTAGSPPPPLATLLLCRPDRVGDVIIATSCLEPIRQQRPDDKLVFIAREAMRPLLEGHPLLDGFIAMQPPAPDAPNLRTRRRDWSRQLAAWNADAIIHLHPDDGVQFSAQAAKIPRRIGYRTSWLADWTLTDRLRDRRATDCRHEAEHNFDVLAPLGIAAPPLETLRPNVHLPTSWLQSLRIRLAAAGFDDFDRSDEPYAVLNPTAYSLDHRWPPAHWAWLATEMLRSGRFMRVFLVGQSIQDPSTREIRHLLGDGVPGLIDLSGETSLAELGWLLRHARLLVSRNTGTTHLAAAVGCPVVELFGRLEAPYGPARWRSLGRSVEGVHTPAVRRGWLENKRAFWRRGHAAIPRETVLDAVLKLADTRPTAGEDSHHLT